MDDTAADFDSDGELELPRDMPLCFRWRAKRAIGSLDLARARNDRYEDARTAVLTQALLASETDRWVSFSRRRAFYPARKRYNGASFGYHTVLSAVADGVDACLLEEERAQPGTRGRQSRFRATERLVNRLKGCELTFELREVIYLRDQNKKPLAYLDNSKTRQMRREVQVVNSNMRSTAIGLSGPELRIAYHHWVLPGATVIPTPPTLHRVFNRGSFEKGGRLYGWWQGLPSEYRAAMTLDGEPVLEPDFAQLHAQIIYALRELPLKGDAYETGIFPRNYGKLAFNIAVNARTPRGAVSAIAKHLSIERRSAVVLLDAITKKHKLIADFFCSDCGVLLMKVDSDITLEAVKGCQASGITVLPVHDSLIVQARQAERAAEIMCKAFAVRFPLVSDCQIRIKAKKSSTDGEDC
jgi:hypothetical protein